jgi:hypothetical protein
MSTFITSSVTWNGKENLEYFLTPMFIGKSPYQTQGVRIIPNVKSGQKLNYFGAASKILKAYAKGFSAANGTTYTQRTLTTYRMKAEAADDANDFYQTVFEYATRTDDWNNLDGTMLKQILQTLYSNAVESDVYRQFWLNDTNKETLDTNGHFSGTADTDYNAYDGMWKMLMDNAATSPSTTQIKRVAFTNGATAQVDTITLTTGSSGSLIITLMGVDYTQVYATSLAATAAAFVVSHAAAMLLRGVTLANPSGAALTFTSTIAGQPFGSPAIASASDITASGGTVNTTANVDADELASGEAEDMFLALYNGADKTLKQMTKKEKVFLVSDSVFENYETYLETLGTERSHLKLENGNVIEDVLYYRGIPVLRMGWDVHLDADFPHNTGENPGYPHRVIYTHIYNLVLGIDSLNQFNGTRMWYNEDEEENRFRTKLVMGCQYVHNKLTAVGY